MKNSFSLMEVIISVVLLSTVMISLFEIKNTNIHILKKAENSKNLNEYLLLSFYEKIDIESNTTLHLDSLFSNLKDELRQEFKKVKIKIKSTFLQNDVIEDQNVLLNITKFKTSYSFSEETKKEIYRFKLEL